MFVYRVHAIFAELQCPSTRSVRFPLQLQCSSAESARISLNCSVRLPSPRAFLLAAWWESAKTDRQSIRAKGEGQHLLYMFWVANTHCTLQDPTIFCPPHWPKSGGVKKNFLLAPLAEFVPLLSKPWRRPWIGPTRYYFYVLSKADESHLNLYRTEITTK